MRFDICCNKEMNEWMNERRRPFVAGLKTIVRPGVVRLLRLTRWQCTAATTQQDAGVNQSRHSACWNSTRSMNNAAPPWPCRAATAWNNDDEDDDAPAICLVCRSPVCCLSVRTTFFPSILAGCIRSMRVLYVCCAESIHCNGNVLYEPQRPQLAAQ